MVESRRALVEKALAGALGSPRQLVLEGGGEHQPPVPRSADGLSSAATSPSLEIGAGTGVSTEPMTAPNGATRPGPEPTHQHRADRTGSDQNPLDPSPPPADPGPSAAQAGPAPIDEKARRLAEFFNGEVVSEPQLDAA